MRLVALALLLVPALATAQPAAPEVGATLASGTMDLSDRIDDLAASVEAEVIAWRRHLHANPELSNREEQTAAYLAERLTELGIAVETGVARHGLVGVLEGGRPGPVVALRADMDALPVREEVDLPFASTVTSLYNGEEVGVMHACGHDTHMAILLGVASVFASLQDDLPGTVKFIFQPAEEGAPAGEAPAGAERMVMEGVLSSAPVPSAIFGLHISSTFEANQIATRPGALMASADDLRIIVRGRQTHGAYPWGGVDPIATSALIVNGLQTIISRQMDITQAPAVVTIGRIDGGVRSNIIPDSVLMVGTIRALDAEMRAGLHERIRRTVTSIAESQGATATVEIGREYAYPVTVNDPDLTARMWPTIERVAGAGAIEAQAVLGAEDFSYYANEIPGLFVWLGARTPGADPADFPSNHSPRFRVDEDALLLGVRTLAHLAADYLQGQP